MDSPGITLAKKIDKMGMRCSDTAVIYFDDVRVPASHIIGEAGGRGVQAPPGRGFTYQMMQFQDERLMAAASCLTPMVRHIEDTIGYTRSPAGPHLPRERKVFGAPLLDNQYVHFRLAELLTEVEMLRSTVYRATDLFVAGESVNWAQ